MKKLFFIFTLCGFSMLLSAQPLFKNIVGQKAPALVVEKWLSKKPNTKGKFVIVDFWATWCAPCRQAIPHMNNISQKFKKDVVVIGLSGETEEKVKAMKNPTIDYFSAVDSKKTTQTVLEIRGIPNIMIINPKQRVVWQGHPMELTDQDIQKFIDDYKTKK